MTTNDGTVLGSQIIVNHGSAAEHSDIVIMGDGYRVDEIIKYHADVDDFIRKFRRTKPFGELWKAINVYRIDVSSTDSGADDPVECGGTGAVPATYFDASFCHDGIQRSLVINDATAIQVANDTVPAWNQIMVLVNSSIYGGTGGATAVASTHADSAEIAIHEIGHSAFGLADEYDDLDCNNVDPDENHYTGSEPLQRNITINTDKNTIKWRHLIDPSTLVPTKKNPDCTKCDTVPSPVPEGTVGAFEGAHKFHCGIYRPEFNCKMRDLGDPTKRIPFCAVCEETIVRALSRYLFTSVPDVLGLSARQARQALLAARLGPRFSGPQTNSEAVSQSPEGGDIVEKGTAVRVKFERLSSVKRYRKVAKKSK